MVSTPGILRRLFNELGLRLAISIMLCSFKTKFRARFFFSAFALRHAASSRSAARSRALSCQTFLNQGIAAHWVGESCVFEQLIHFLGAQCHEDFVLECARLFATGQ